MAHEALEQAWQWRETDPQRCAQLLAQLPEPLAGPPGPDLVRAAHLVTHAYLAFRDACQAEALSRATEALGLLEARPDSPWYTRALNVRSCALLELGEHEQATLSLREQVRASRANGDAESEGAGLHDLGVLHTRGDPGHAEGYLRAALDLFEALDHTVGRAFCAFSLGELRAAQASDIRAMGPAPQAAAQRLDDEALSLYQQSLGLARQAGHLPMEVLVLSRLGELALARGAAREGEARLREAVAREAAQAGRRPLWVSVPPLVRLMMHEGRLDEARDTLQAQLHRAEQAQMLVPRVALHELLAEVHEALGDPAQALRHAREHHRLFRQENADEQGRRVRALEVLQRTELAEQEARAQRKLSEQLQQTLTELRALHRQVEATSITDELTGIHNRHHLMTRGAARVQADPGHTAIAILDLDHFKAVNDTYGHDGGDRVLRACAQFLRAGLGAGSLLSRFGGEEFVVIFPDTALTHAAQQLETLRAALAGAAVEGLPATLRISFTAGVVACCDRDLLGALRRADALLLEGKRRGRGVVLHEARRTTPQEP